MRNRYNLAANGDAGHFGYGDGRRLDARGPVNFSSKRVLCAYDQMDINEFDPAGSAQRSRLDAGRILCSLRCRTVGRSSFNHTAQRRDRCGASETPQSARGNQSADPLQTES